MKKFLVLLLILFISIMSCSKGDQGLMGPSGSKGDTGGIGDPGAGDTLYITSDTVWNLNKVLNYNVFIEKGVTLTIMPGVEIKMYPNYDIQCNGKIIAEGSSFNKILFYCSILPGDSEIFVNQSTNIFSYCVFKRIYSIEQVGNKTSTLILRNCDFISNESIINGRSMAGWVTVLSNNFIAYNNGSSDICISTVLNDTNVIRQYYGLSDPIIAPRTTPNFP